MGTIRPPTQHRAQIQTLPQNLRRIHWRVEAPHRLPPKQGQRRSRILAHHRGQEERRSHGGSLGENPRGEEIARGQERRVEDAQRRARGDAGTGERQQIFEERPTAGEAEGYREGEGEEARTRRARWRALGHDVEGRQEGEALHGAGIEGHAGVHGVVGTIRQTARGRAGETIIEVVAGEETRQDGGRRRGRGHEQEVLAGRGPKKLGYIE
mmetsp:Transcript_11964/g.29261  ORF Transcript_11964/g.29261 Transcript_11964/m.29261 type:complete len:211 (-) Transcript_11964:518-1150(-)